MQITFRDSTPSDALREAIEKRVDKVRERYGQITSCDVVISEPHKHKNQGNLFHCRIEIHLPGLQAVVDRSPDDHAHEDAHVAVRDAFDSLERQLEHQRGKQRSKH